MPTHDGHGGKNLAPVTYLPGVAPEAERAKRPSTVAFAESYWVDEEVSEVEVEVSGAKATDAEVVEVVGPDDVDVEADRESFIAAASTTLTRSLGRRGLSIAEARTTLRSSGLTGVEIDEVVQDFARRGWLDDAVLAEQLVHSATTRQDMGTKAVRQLLQKRMLAREVIDAVIAELPDDDAERALEFATAKARSLVRYDDATATRRLMGQLARRGFGGSVASLATRTALEQARSEAGGGSGVRFR